MSATLATHHPSCLPDAEAAVLTKATGRTAGQLGLTNAALGQVLGVSEATASRVRSGTYLLKPGSKEAELAVLLIRLFRGLDALVGGDAGAARSWLQTHNVALGGKPIELARTVTGLVQAVMHVDAFRARV